MSNRCRSSTKFLVGLVVLFVAAAFASATAWAQVDMRMNAITIVGSAPPQQAFWKFTNQETIYTMNVTNLSSQGATGVTITVTLTTDVTVINAVPTNGTNWACSISNPVVCSYLSKTIPPNIFNQGSPNGITITARAPSSEGTFSGASACVSANEGDPDPSNNCVSNNTLITVSNKADMKMVSITPSSSAPPQQALYKFTSQLFTYTMTLTNVGDEPAGASIIVTLPSNVTFVSALGTLWSCRGTGPVTCDRTSAFFSSPTGPTITVRAPDTEGSVSGVSACISVIVTNPSPLGQQYDPDHANDCVSNDTVLTISNLADMKMNAISVSNTAVTINQIFSYSMNVSNLGPEPAGARITANLPLGETYTGASGTNWLCNSPPASQVVCDHSNAFTGSPTGITINVKSTANCSYNLTATVSVIVTNVFPVGPQYDNLNGNDQATSPTTTVSPCDTTPPVINFSFTPDGQNGWFITTPVSGSVTATDAASNVSTLICTPALSFSGLTGTGTSSASATLTVSAQGTSNISCTATDSPGNSSTNTTTIKLDSVAPSVTVTPSRAADQNGFYNHAVVFTTTGSDATSDAVVCITPITYSGPDSASASVTGTCTDSAGNTANASLGFSYDATGPTISGSRAPAANANGWNNTDVTVHFICSDAPAGVDTLTPDVVLSTEGANQSVTGTCVDNAGNSATALVDNINLDKSAPVIAGSRTPVANANGWNDTDVAVHFECTDALAGVDTLTPDTVLSADGAGQAVTGACTDKAGNSASATVGDINIDKTGPVITGSRTPAANANGWNNVDVTVHFDCTDALAGVDTLTPDTVLSGEGAGQFVDGSCSDKAGNIATTSVSNINIDKSAPVVTGSRTPAANANGWNDTAVTVHFDCDDSLSGLESLTPDTVLSSDGAGQSVTGTCVDKAGNSANASVGNINISLGTSGPIITGSRTPVANANGWNNTDVTVHFTCTDALAGVDTLTPDVVLGSEGADQSVTGTCVDKAGHSATAVVENISIDKSAPGITGSRTPAANASGWNNSDVTVHFDCTDALAGVDTLTPDEVLSTEGAVQSLTGACADKAGNIATASVGNINIDKSGPVITGSRTPAANANGWNNVDVTVHFECTDALAGVDTLTPDTVLSADGAAQSVTGTCVDKAGNSATALVDNINIDKSAPVITGSRTPAANANSWNNTDVVVHFACNDVLSGIDNLTPDTSLDSDGAAQSVNGTCMDRAGNSATALVDNINIDKTGPIITGSRTPAANANGWNNTDVVVSFACADALSDVESFTAPTTLSAEGAGQSVTGSCTDKAANSASAVVANINIDKTAPVITISSPLDGAAFQQGSAVASSYSCADALSGAASCAGPVASGANLNTASLGNQSFTVTAADLAGNVATLSHSYSVNNAQYTFIGFLNPLKSEVYSGVYKLGSTISIKWQLKDASGQYVSALSAIVSLKVDSVVCDGTPDNTAPIDPAGAGDTGLHYDSSANQYIFNWQTKGLAEGCYKILLTLNDQSVHSTRVQLKR